MMKNYLFLVFLLFYFYKSHSQVKIAEATFEIPGGYTTSIPEFTDLDKDYFKRTDGSDINGEVYTNTQGTYYFGAQDLDGEGATIPLSLFINDIDISGYENLEFRVYLAEDDDGANQDWDEPDYVHFSYDIDNSGTYTNLIWIENDGSTFNSAPFIDTDFDGTGDGTEITDNFEQFIEAIAATGNDLDIEIEFNLNAADEDIAIDSIEIWGTFQACSATTTWTNSGWSAGPPDINTSAILDFDYDTATNGNIIACSLTINTGIELNVENNTYVEIKNEINNTGDIFVQTRGSVVQRNDGSVNASSGTITVLKSTALLSSPLVYTYWSSPVNGETIEDTFSLVPNSRRFYFEAINFEDNLAEVGNTGVFNAGQDDIDDTSDAWQLASGNMSAGVGYAAMAQTLGFFPATQQFSFIGDFNNGIIQPAIVNNSGGAYNDWNFVGNPYPSAIDTNLFFTTNSGIVDTIYLWSQATDPDSNTQGNEVLNFSQADYAVISASGVNTAGGSGIIPNDFVPSGQGFFIEALSGSNVTFNNAMRVTGNNDQFFRNSISNQKEVLWVNLTSDNGVFNQLAVAYLQNSTDGFDGSYYDVKRNKSISTFSKIYSFIDGNDDEFVIQGRSLNSLDSDEIIPIGFNTNINEPTIFTISLAQVEGAFMTSNDVYVVDKLLNNIHNLKLSDYNFTSEVGTFNERFEIVFNANALSIDDNSFDPNELTITELSEKEVQIKVGSNQTITNVEILDVLGRSIYSLIGNSSSEVYDISKLSKAAYIAKVTLANGQTVSKKAIKRL